MTAAAHPGGWPADPIAAVTHPGLDPAANPDSGRFNIFRQDRRILNFGGDVHACPADSLASRIASFAVAHLLGVGLDLGGLRDSLSYMPSVAVRAPLFGSGRNR